MRTIKLVFFSILAIMVVSTAVSIFFGFVSFFVRDNPYLSGIVNLISVFTHLVAWALAVIWVVRSQQVSPVRRVVPPPTPNERAYMHYQHQIRKKRRSRTFFSLALIIFGAFLANIGRAAYSSH